MVALRRAALAALLAAFAGIAAEAQTVSSMTDATLPLTNQEYLYIVQNGQPRRVHPSAIVPSGLTIPNADLLGGLDNAFTVVTVGSNLSLASGILSMPVPTTDLLGGSGNAFTNIAAGTALEIVSGNLNLADTAVTPGTYTNTTLTVDQQGRLTAASSGSEACSDVTATAVIFSDGATCVGDYPNFVYLSTIGQLQIINKVPTANDDTAAAIRVESPDVNLRGAIQFGVSNLSGSGAYGRVGFQDAGDARDGPYTYFNTSDGSPILLGSEVGALGAPRVGINYIGCMIADLQCAHGDLQILGHHEDHEGGSQYWALVFGDGAATQGGFKLDPSGYGYMELGRSEVSNFIPRVHIAENGDSYLTSFGASSNFGLGTNLPLTKLDVVGDITTRTVLSCNGVNDAVQTDGTGKLVCGSISGGGGGVTASGTLTTNALAIGGGTSVVSALGSLGTTTTVLHGNAAGPPTFGAVSLTADVSGTLPGDSGGTGVANSGKTLTLGATATSLPTAPGSTQCLHMDSGGNVTATGADCTGGGGTSGLSLISTLTATNTATNLAWTGLTGSRYMLVIENLVPATDGATLVAQFGQGGTPTYKTTGYQYNLTFFSITSVDSGTVRNNAATGFPIAAAVHSTNGVENCQINFTGLNGAVRHAANFTGINESSAAGNNTYNQYGGGVYTADTTAITAIRIITDGGNLASGSASLYLMN